MRRACSRLCCALCAAAALRACTGFGVRGRGATLRGNMPPPVVAAATWAVSGTPRRRRIASRALGPAKRQRRTGHRVPALPPRRRRRAARCPPAAPGPRCCRPCSAGAGAGAPAAAGTARSGCCGGRVAAQQAPLAARLHASRARPRSVLSKANLFLQLLFARPQSQIS